MIEHFLNAVGASQPPERYCTLSYAVLPPFFYNKKKKKPCAFRKAFFGAPSAGALRKRSGGAFLATGPRELRRSACANAEAAPAGGWRTRKVAAFSQPETKKKG